jgi:hypothetical protein
MQQQQYIDLQSSSTYFGQFFAHPQERKIVIYSMWCNVPRLLSVGGLEGGGGGTDCVFGVKDVARATSFTPMDDGFEKMWKKAVAMCSYALFRHWPGGTERNHEASVRVASVAALLLADLIS